MARKVVQIQMTDELLMALADDGTVWAFEGDDDGDSDADGKWVQLPKLPQD